MMHLTVICADSTIIVVAQWRSWAIHLWRACYKKVRFSARHGIVICLAPGGDGELSSKVSNVRSSRLEYLSFETSLSVLCQRYLSLMHVVSPFIVEIKYAAILFCHLVLKEKPR